MNVGTVGSAIAVVLMGVVRKKWTLAELKNFEAETEKEGGKVFIEGGTNFTSPNHHLTFEVLRVLDDDNKKKVFVKVMHHGESSTIVEYRNSGDPLGGKKLIGSDEEVSFMTIDNAAAGEHAFIKLVIKHCSSKLADVDPVKIICLDSGLNRSGTSVFLAQRPTDCAALERIISNVGDAFFVASSRNLVTFDPPTEGQHTATLKLIAGHAKNGTTAFVHHQRDQDVKAGSYEYIFEDCAKKTSDRAFDFIKDVVDGTVGQNVYGVCQFASPVPLTPMQKMKATLLSDPDDKEAIAYLMPRVGADHVEKLKACGRAVKDNKSVLLALAAAASAPVGGTRKRRR